MSIISRSNMNRVVYRKEADRVTYEVENESFYAV
jgi:hypothetical protein